ncbi:MAG: hypothetical protein HY863_18260 [Chloroflexi bacterium]|nr:hypothetical protein [Chloroflexota bacterium]
MAPRHHSHPRYMQWFKSILAVLALAFPPYMIWNSFTSVVPISSLMEIIVTVILSFFMMVSLLVTAYFFQDIWMDEEGLQIEFLWKKVRVRWIDMIEAKPAWGFLGQEEKCPLIVLVKGLTLFHRVFGIIYGISIKPGFVIFPSISDFQKLKVNIQDHINNKKMKRD